VCLLFIFETRFFLENPVSGCETRFLLVGKKSARRQAEGKKKPGFK
jgi:hypothetical protein